MKKGVVIFSLLFAIFGFTTTAAAQDATGASDLSVDGAITLPLGDWADIAGLGLGAGLRYEYTIIPQLNLTGRVLLTYHLEEHDWSWIDIPILAGAQYFFLASDEGPYVAGELGLTYYYGEWDGQTGAILDDDTSDTGLTFTAGGGYHMGDLDFRGHLYVSSVDSEELYGLIATVGYRFLTF